MNAEIAAIRNAFASGEFARAHRLWSSYAEGLTQAVRAGKASQAMIDEARELVDWARLTVRTFQAHARSRINAAAVAQFYSDRAAPPRNLLRTSL